MKKLIFLTLLLGQLGLFAQVPPRTWYFGDGAAIYFGGAPNNGSHSMVGAAQAPTTSLVVNDPDGNVMFYTNGRALYNENHVYKGQINAAQYAFQGVAGIPLPCSEPSCQKYMLFSSAIRGSYNTGVSARIIDIPTTGIEGQVSYLLKYSDNTPIRTTEQIAATSDGNGGYWVVTHGISDSFAPWNPKQTFFKIHVPAGTCSTDNLINNITTQNIGSEYREFGFLGNSLVGVGAIKFSPDGKKLAIVQLGEGALGSANYRKIVEVYDFDLATGVLSNLKTISHVNGGFDNDETHLQGLEFSPNSELLYANTSGSTLYNSDFSASNPAEARIYQYNLLAGSGTETDIVNSRVLVYSEIPANPLGPDPYWPYNYYQEWMLGYPQLAPDNKIYFPKPFKNTLNVINNPNAIGLACSVGIYTLASGTCGYGLPTNLVYNPCEMQTCTNCDCDQNSSIENVRVSENGIATAYTMLYSSAGMNVSKIKLTVVNYEFEVDKNCLETNINQLNKYGNVIMAPEIDGSLPLYSTFQNYIEGEYSREVIWCLDKPKPIEKLEVNLNLLLPEYNCEESYNIDLCIRVEFWDEECNVCEQLICFDGTREFPEIPGEGNPDWRPTGNGSSNLKPELPINSKEIKVYPNPASSEFTIEVDKEFSGLNVDIFNEKGSLVKRVVLQNEITKVNATDLTSGVYMLKIEKGNKSASGKIVIQ